MGIKEKILSKKKESYWITLGIIAFLEEKMDKEKETWDLVVCKARTWLKEKNFQTERSWRRRLVRSFSGESESLFLLGVYWPIWQEDRKRNVSR